MGARDLLPEGHGYPGFVTLQHPLEASGRHGRKLYHEVLAGPNMYPFRVLAVRSHPSQRLTQYILKA